MSAFIVGNDHIDLILTAGLDLTCRGGSPLRWHAPEEPEGEADYERGEVWGSTAIETAQRRTRTLSRETVESVGLMLLAQNYASVNHRYNENEWAPIYRYRGVPHMPSAVQVLKALDCYEYQACETPGYDTTEAFDFIRALRKRMIQKLVGYSDAKWEWSR